jgi:hypothetical protein
VTVTDPELMVAVNVPMSAPPASWTVAVQVPAVTGLATTDQLVPEPVGVPKVTLPVPVQVPNVIPVVETGSVIVNVWS